MSLRSPHHRLLIVVLLSQVMAIQALLSSWGGTLAVQNRLWAGAGILCSSATDRLRVDGSGQPASPVDHRDCLSACLMGLGAIGSSGQAVSAIVRTAYEQFLVADHPLRRTSTPARNFLARAPPQLI